MSGRAWFWLFALMFAAAGVGCGWLFWVQNSAQPAPVSFELWGLGRWGRTWKVSELIAVSAGAGFLAGFLPFGWLWLRARSRANQAEARLAMSQPADDGRAWR